MIDRKKIKSDLEQTSLALIEESQKLEPSQSEVCASHTTQMKIVYENKDFSISSSHSSTTYGLRSITANKLGFCTSNSLNKDTLKDFAREAQMMALLSPSNAHNLLPKDTRGESYFENYDVGLENLNPKELLNFGQQLIDEARKDARVSIDRAQVQLSFDAYTVVNSYGVLRTAVTSNFNASIMGMAKTEKEVTSFDYDGDNVASKAEIGNMIARTIGRFRESVVGSLGAQKGNSYKGAVLLHPFTAMDLIGSAIVANINGLSHTDKISSWAGKVGQKVVSEMLEAFEDPLDKLRPSGWTPFDREGVITQKHNIINSGILNFIAHNSYSASRAGVVSTGNASGASRSLPGIGLSNFGLSASPRAKALSDSELESQLHNGLLLKRFSGNADPISGQFSGVAKNSWLIENGKRGRPVQEVMVSGNIFDVMNQILAIGKDPHIQMGHAPYILVDGLSVTAG